MTIDRAREIVQRAAQRGPFGGDLIFDPAMAIGRIAEVVHALCVVENACGMREVSDAELRDQYQRMVDLHRAHQGREGAVR